MKKVIGITGTIGSGKNLVRDIIQKKFSAYPVSLSSIIRAELEKKKSIFNRTTLQDLGNVLRQKYGGGVLAMLAVEYLQRDKDLIIIDGIRNPGEVEYLKKKFGRDFALISVDAPPETRFERISRRASETDPKSWEEFLEMDKRDLGENEPEYGQQVKKCMEMADFSIINDGTTSNLENKINEVMSQLMG